MNRKIKFPLIGLLFIILASNSFAEVDLINLVKKIQPAVVTVITFDKNKKPLGQGSGFFIDANGLLVTNYHVLKGAYHAVVKTYDGKKYPIKYVVSKNKYMDLIKVLVDLPQSSFRWINLTGNLPSIAERVVVVGSPMGLELTVSEGIVSAVRQIPDVGKILQISAPISSGSSGSPVVNMREQVVGVVSFYLAKGQSLNFAVPSQYLINLKPAKTLKTLSEWTYAVDQKANQQRKGRLYVHTDPERARVRILNIKPKFYQGIMLKPGQYHIEVSADGYEMKKRWTKILPGEEKKVPISLQKLIQFSKKNTKGLISIGLAYQEKKEYEKSIEVYKQVLHKNPDNAFVYSRLGVSYFFIALYREAVEAYKQAILIDPDNADYHYLLGVTYERLSLDREAMEAYDQAIWIDLDHAPAHFALGAIYARYNSWREAEEQYQILKTLDKKKANELSKLINKNKD